MKQLVAHAAAFAAQWLSLNALMLTNCSPQTQVALNRNSLIDNGTQSTYTKSLSASRLSGQVALGSTVVFGAVLIQTD
jgi:hypothetical protein